MRKEPHAFRDMSPEEQENLFNDFLINSWSYSKIMSFARNEKVFEMEYIYRHKSRASATTIAGQAYHEALEKYFQAKQEGGNLDLVNLETIAFDFIDEVPPNEWKIQKTTPSVEDCKKKAYKVVTSLLQNFMSENAIYEDEIKEILAVEVYSTEFLIINGVDIPLPCNSKIDLVILTKEDKIAVVDHKSKMSFTDEKELKLSIGKQAITYVKSFESASGNKVDEVWFVENKYSKNKDKAPQLRNFKVEINEDTRKLYESMLYEPLKRMLEAISDPDYVYIINENDNFSDKSEVYEFWAQTMIAEVEDFDIPQSKHELVRKRLKKIRDSHLASIDPKVIKNFKENASKFIQYDLTNKNMTTQEKIEHTLRTFGIVINVAHVIKGYSSDTFLVEVSAGTTLASIHRHKLDIANALNVSNIRMMKDLFVYEGKSYLAIESSKKREKDLIWDPSHLDGMKIPIGVDNFNRTVIWDLNNHSTPHMLICGATGSGKSVSIKSTIEYARLAGVEKIVVFDPKFEFQCYQDDMNISVYNEIEVIEEQMKRLVDEMNDMVKSGKKRKTLVVFDEFADAVSAARKGKELDIMEEVQVGTYAPKKVKGIFGETVEPGLPKMAMKKVGELKSLEENLKILLQKGRSSGFRIISATQRASTKVITGDAKVNFPVQICFRVPKEVDSKVVIDEAGAESLMGKGDGLIKSPEYFDIIRFQAFWKPDDEQIRDAS